MGGPTLVAVEEDRTVELEQDLHGLLETVGDDSQREGDLLARRGAPTDESIQFYVDEDLTRNSQAPLTEEHTVELESDLGALLRNNDSCGSSNSASSTSSGRKAKKQKMAEPVSVSEDHTVDLEADLNTLLRATAPDDDIGEESDGGNQGGEGMVQASQTRNDVMGQMDVSLTSIDLGEDSTVSGECRRCTVVIISRAPHLKSFVLPF